MVRSRSCNSEYEENEKERRADEAADDEFESDDNENIALKFTTSNLLSFSWQIGSGMVQASRLFFPKLINAVNFYL